MPIILTFQNSGEMAGLPGKSPPRVSTRLTPWSHQEEKEDKFDYKSYPFPLLVFTHGLRGRHHSDSDERHPSSVSRGRHPRVLYRKRTIDYP
jgi:hypothetical protein